MDVQSISQLKTSQVQQQAGVLVLKKAMDQSEGQAAMVNQMLNQSTQAITQQMERSISPHLGGNIDIRI